MAWAGNPAPAQRPGCNARGISKHLLRSRQAGGFQHTTTAASKRGENIILSQIDQLLMKTAAKTQHPCPYLWRSSVYGEWRSLGWGVWGSRIVLVGVSLVHLCLPTDLRNDPEHGAVLWHKEQLRLLSRESRGGEGGSRADGARGDPKCHQVTRRHFNKRQRKLCI